MTPAPAGSLWRNRGFRALWAGETISQFGDRITEIALPLIAVTLLDASAAQVGVLTAAVWLPNMVALFVGAWVDRRTHKRRLLIVADLARAAMLVSLPVAYLLGAVTLTQLYLVALLTGAGQVLFGMAYQSFFAALVPPASYIDATSKLSLSRAASFVAGPAVGGVLVQVLTAPVAVLADALSFLGSALLISRIRVADSTPAPAGPSTARLALDGLRLVLRHPMLRASLASTTTVNFFSFMANALLILYASRELGLSPGAIGLAIGLGALGAVAGAALAPRAARLLGAGPCAIVGCALFPAPYVLMAAAGGPLHLKIVVLAGAEFLSSVGVMLLDVPLNAILTHLTPDDARGRRAGAYSAVNYGIRPLGALAGGALGTALGLRETLVIAGVGGILSAGWMLVSPIRRLRTIVEPATDAVGPATGVVEPVGAGAPPAEPAS
jgi:MFS family permease